MSISFDFSSINLKNRTPEDIRAIQAYGLTFQRRLDFAQYHFDNFLSAFEMTAQDPDKSGFATEISAQARSRYEPEIDAFLRNLHCVVDSLPYLIWLLYPQHRGITDEMSVYWRFLTRNAAVFGRYPWYTPAMELRESNEFEELMEYCNTSKHRFLPRVKRSFFPENAEVQLFIEQLRSVSEQPTYLNAKAFLVQCHDRLIPKCMIVLDSINS